jgi:hypothetical protein
MKTFNNLPLYSLSIDETSGISAISLVDEPATEVMMLTFNNKVRHKFEIHKDKQIITAPVMTANVPIYRNDNHMGEHYVFYSPETIQAMQIKYHIDNLTHAFTEDHTAKKIDNATMIESWIVSNEQDKAYGLGFTKEQIPVGTWMCSVYFKDINYWNNVIKSGKFGGISLEGLFIHNLNFAKQEMTDSKLLSIVYQMFNEGKTNIEIEEFLNRTK